MRASQEYRALAQHVLRQDRAALSPVKRHRVPLGVRPLEPEIESVLKKEPRLWFQRINHFHHESLPRFSTEDSNLCLQQPLSHELNQCNAMPPLRATPSISASPDFTAASNEAKGCLPDLPVVATADMPPLRATASTSVKPELTTAANEAKGCLPPVATAGLGAGMAESWDIFLRNVINVQPLPSLPQLVSSAPPPALTTSQQQLLHLFSGALAPRCVFSFRDKLMAQCSSGLRAHSCRKGFVSLGAGLKTLGGGASLVNFPRGTLREAARDSANACKDAMTSFNALAAVSICETESARIQTSLAAAPRPRLDNLYFLMVVESIWMAALKEANDEEEIVKHAKRLAGYVYYQLVLSRPVTRAGVLGTTDLGLLDGQLRDGVNLNITYSDHKTSSSYGTLLTSLPAWVQPTVSFYLSHVRAALADSSVPTLFPANYANLLQHFFASTIGRRPATVSQIRSAVCEDIGEIASTHPQWGPHRMDLQYCAGHQAGGVVLRHYEVSQKPARELVLQAFVDQEYLRPALEKVRDLLRASVRDGDVLDCKIAPVKRKAAEPQHGAPKKPREEKSAESVTQPRICRNRKRSKRCLSLEQRIEPKFDSMEQPNCNSCIIGYQANGNWTKLRAEKHDATTD